MVNIGLIDWPAWSIYVMIAARVSTMSLLPDTQNCGVRMRRECFPRLRRLAIPTCNTARALRTCRDTCWDP